MSEREYLPQEKTRVCSFICCCMLFIVYPGPSLDAPGQRPPSACRAQCLVLLPAARPWLQSAASCVSLAGIHPARSEQAKTGPPASQKVPRLRGLAAARAAECSPRTPAPQVAPSVLLPIAGNQYTCFRPRSTHAPQSGAVLSSLLIRRQPQSATRRGPAHSFSAFTPAAGPAAACCHRNQLISINPIYFEPPAASIARAQGAFARSATAADPEAACSAASFSKVPRRAPAASRPRPRQRYQEGLLKKNVS
jgi:hypothetical protein